MTNSEFSTSFPKHCELNSTMVTKEWLLLATLLLGLLFSVDTQPNPSLPYTVATGCVSVTVSPSSGTVLNVAQATNIDLTFNQNVEYFRATNYRKLLSAYTSGGTLNYATLLTDLNTASTGKPAAVYLMNAATNDIFKPNSATNNGRGDFLRVTFNANTLPNNAFLYLFVVNRFMDGNYQNYMMEFLGYMNYTTGTGVASGTPVNVPPVPSFCPSQPSLSPTTVVPNTDPPVFNIVGSLCNGNVAGLACNWTLTANLDFSGYTPFNTTITSFVDDAGDTYSLKYPLKISAQKSSTELKLPITLNRMLTPNLEYVEGNVATSNFLSDDFEEVPSTFIQPYFDLLPSATLYLYQYARYWTADDTKIVDEISAANAVYNGLFTFANGSQVVVLYSQRSTRPTYRWFRSFPVERGGKVCTKGSARNVFCPNCDQELHTWYEFTFLDAKLIVIRNTVSQLPYGAYNVNPTPSDYQLNYPLYVRMDYAANFDDAYFSDRTTEGGLKRFFTANVSLPSGASLNQAASFNNRRLVLPDLASTPSPANYLWRLVPMSYFGGGCDKIDVSQVDFYNQPNFCSSAYGTCMNYQLSYWMKDTTISTLPAVINNFTKLYGTIDGTKERMRIEGSNLVMSYNPALERVPVTININAQRAGMEILEPMIGTWSIDKQVTGQAYTLTLTITNSGDGPGLFTFGGVCPESISIDGAAQTVPAGSTVNLTIGVDATATSLSGNYSCSLFISIPQQKLWSTSNKYVTSMMDFSLENGCTDSSTVTTLGQPFLVYSESVWRINPNPFAAQQNPFSITPLAWTSSANDLQNFTVLVSSSVKNGGNLQGSFNVTVDECQISTGDNTISIYGSSVTILIDAGATSTIQVPVLYLGSPGFSNVSITCTWQVSVTRATCWSSKGKQFTQPITVQAPYNYCLDYSTNDITASESYLLMDKQWWSQHESDPQLSSMNLIGWSQVEWSTSDQVSFTKFLVAQIHNSGPSSANFTASLSCSDQSLQLFATPQAECTNLATDANCTVTLTIRSNTSYLSAQQMNCDLSASLVQSFGTVSYCWSSLGKQYTQSISLVYPVLIAAQQPGVSGTDSPKNSENNNSASGLFGIGEGASIGVLVVIIVVGVAAIVVPVVVVHVHKMNASQSNQDEFEGFDEDEAAKQRKMITQSTLPSAQMEHELQATA